MHNKRACRVASRMPRGARGHGVVRHVLDLHLRAREAGHSRPTREASPSVSSAAPFSPCWVDDSEAFDVARTQDGDPAATAEERVLSGLGLFLVHQMMDEVGYRRLKGCNVVTLAKRIDPAEPSPSSS